jgi:hypothetical protein
MARLSHPRLQRRRACEARSTETYSPLRWILPALAAGVTFSQRSQGGCRSGGVTPAIPAHFSEAGFDPQGRGHPGRQSPRITRVVRRGVDTGSPAPKKNWWTGTPKTSASLATRRVVVEVIREQTTGEPLQLAPCFPSSGPCSQSRCSPHN